MTEGLASALAVPDPVQELYRLGYATDTSLELPENLPYDTYEALGLALRHRQDQTTWWLSDWLLFGEKKYGETYTQAVMITGLAEGTLANYASTAHRVPRERRRPELKFGHHTEVAALQPQDQTEWLDRAVTNNWSRNELRSQIRPVAPDIITPALPTLEEAARDLVRSAKQYGNDYLVHRPSFVQLCAALGEEP